MSTILGLPCLLFYLNLSSGKGIRFVRSHTIVFLNVYFPDQNFQLCMTQRTEQAQKKCRDLQQCVVNTIGIQQPPPKDLHFTKLGELAEVARVSEYVSVFPIRKYLVLVNH